MSFRRYGGLNYSANQNFSKNHYGVSVNSTITEKVGLPNSNIVFESSIVEKNNLIVDGSANFNGPIFTNNTLTGTTGIFNSITANTITTNNFSIGTSFVEYLFVANLSGEKGTFNFLEVANLTGGTITATGLIRGGSLNSNGTITASGLISANGGITSTKINASGLISANGGVTSTTINASGLISANGGIVATEEITATKLTAYGIITANYGITSSGLITANAGVTGTTITASGLITANAGITATELITATTITASGLITANAGIDASGAITASGLITASSFNASSDYRIKDNVRPIYLNEYSIDKLIPVTYTNKITGNQDMGLIAHEVQSVLPFLVNGEKDGDKIQSVNYIGLIGLLIKEVQTLKNEIVELKRSENIRHNDLLRYINSLKMDR